MLDIHLLGPTVIDGGSGRIYASDLGGTKIRQLVGMLALDLGSPLSKDLIAERLWDGQPPAGHVATIESYVCVLRRRLGLVGGRRGPLATTSHGYLLDPDLVRVDVVHLRQLLRGPVADVLLALDLMSGELFAEDPYCAWAADARASFIGVLADRCTHAAGQANLLGDFEVAVRLAREATQRSSFSEPAARELMTALVGSGSRALALDTYETLRTCLAEELGLSPEPETQALYAQVLRGCGSDENRGRDHGDEVSVLLQLLRSLLKSDSTMAIDRSSMFEVGQLLLARVG